MAFYAKQCRKCYLERIASTAPPLAALHKYRAANPRAGVEVNRAWRLRTLYDMTIEEYDKLLDYQEGVCAICQKPSKKIRLSVDHDHKTGEIRGLLCTMCNRHLSERISTDWLLAAYEYLDAPLVFDALGRVPVGVKGRIGSKKRKKKK